MVIIFVIVVFGLMFIYGLFLMCLDPIMNKRRTTYRRTVDDMAEEVPADQVRCFRGQRSPPGHPTLILLSALRSVVLTDQICMSMWCMWLIPVKSRITRGWHVSYFVSSTATVCMTDSLIQKWKGHCTLYCDRANYGNTHNEYHYMIYSIFCV